MPKTVSVTTHMNEVERAKAARREYDRRYRQQHKSQIAESQRRYWAQKYEAQAIPPIEVPNAPTL